MATKHKRKEKKIRPPLSLVQPWERKRGKEGSKILKKEKGKKGERSFAASFQEGGKERRKNWKKGGGGRKKKRRTCPFPLKWEGEKEKENFTKGRK